MTSKAGNQSEMNKNSLLQLLNSLRSGNACTVWFMGTEILADSARANTMKAVCSKLKGKKLVKERP